MRFAIATDAGLSLGEYDELAPCIRLEEGRADAGMKRPKQLAPGETTRVVYPLMPDFENGEARSIACLIERLPDSTAGVDFGTGPANEAPADEPKQPAKTDNPPASGARRRPARRS